MPERSGRSRRNDALMRAFLSFSFSRRPVPCRFSRSGWELTQADRHRPAANAQVASFVARADARMAVDHHDPGFLCTPRHALPGGSSSGAIGSIWPHRAIERRAGARRASHAQNYRRR
jgi:hypothetical protein